MYSSADFWFTERSLSSAPTMFSAPGDSGAGETLDFSFEVAFHRASVLIAKYQRRGFQGAPDLVAALEEAQEIGRRPLRAAESYQTAARAFGMDLKAERREKMATICRL